MFQKCDKCGKGIGFNEAYVSITYNLQKQTHDLATQENVIDIKHSEIVMVFCGNCGNQHNARKIKKAVNLKEVVYQDIPTPAVDEEVKPEVKSPEIKGKLSFEKEMKIRTFPHFVQHTLRRMVQEDPNASVQEIYDESIKGLVDHFT